MFRINSEVTIPEGKLEVLVEAFRAHVVKMADAEPRTHSYIAHISEDGKRCQVEQYYEDEAAFLDHLRVSAVGLGEVINDHKEDFRYWIYNEVTIPEVQEIIAKVANPDLLVVSQPAFGYTREVSGGPVSFIGLD